MSVERRKNGYDRIYLPTESEINEQHEWIMQKIEELDPEVLDELMQGTVKIRERAYSPYSGYSVGAGLLTKSGDMYFSVNAEAVTYTETDHAERSVITKAISEGAIEKDGEKFIEAIVVSHEGESGPCGGCRQRIAQHAENCLVIDVDEKGENHAVTSLKLLIPYAFTPSHLKEV